MVDDLPVDAVMVRRLIAAASLLLVLGCSGPNEEQVKKEFQRDNPSVEVTDVYVSEGDAQAAYFTIKYRMPDETAHVACWSYLAGDDGVWRTNAKTSVPERLVTKNYCR